MTLIVTSGIIFLIISIFSSEIKRPLLYLIGFIFWPLSLILILTYLFFVNTINERKKWSI